jgi:pimeloyl-ACP methyl ester carboxylesterase
VTHSSTPLPTGQHTPRDLDPDAFEIHRAPVRDGVEIAYVREGVGGLPLVMVHGWPGSKRLFWRNIAPLAAAGFEVIVPDARGYGDSSVPEAPERFADMGASAIDIKELLDGLGITRCVAVAGDWGSGVVQDLTLRYPGLVERQVIYNGLAPVITETYEAAGIPGEQLVEVSGRTDHIAEHGEQPDELAARFDSNEKRLEYIKSFFFERVWRPGASPMWLAGREGFDDASATFQAEQLADADRFRASMGYYEAASQPHLAEVEPLLFQPNPDTPTLILYGAEDELIGEKFTRRMEVAMGAPVGPYYVQGAGHFLQWERADLLNRAIVSFCGDLLAQARNR